MKVNELSGLYVVENKKENFKILVAALDEQEAMKIARDYFMESHMEHENLTVHKFTDVDTNFDCDYIVTKGQ